MPKSSAPSNRHARRHPDDARRRYASVQEAAEYIGCTDRTVRAMIADGRLTPFRGLGARVLRVDLNEIDEKMANR
jgi:excisionase family DNA binding protein